MVVMESTNVFNSFTVRPLATTRAFSASNPGTAPKADVSLSTKMSTSGPSILWFPSTSASLKTRVTTAIADIFVFVFDLWISCWAICTLPPHSACSTSRPFLSLLSFVHSSESFAWLLSKRSFSPRKMPTCFRNALSTSISLLAAMRPPDRQTPSKAPRMLVNSMTTREATPKVRPKTVHSMRTKCSMLQICRGPSSIHGFNAWVEPEPVLSSAAFPVSHPGIWGICTFGNAASS
mmetsp:Transcript_111667/g.360475  ORF Transcript_111667/g.360475 Transcript_111667/m.360475 type:complete len:235 (+) Transcript_111667:195-899(+)